MLPRVPSDRLCSERRWSDGRKCGGPVRECAPIHVIGVRDRVDRGAGWFCGWCTVQYDPPFVPRELPDDPPY